MVVSCLFVTVDRVLAKVLMLIGVPVQMLKASPVTFADDSKARVKALTMSLTWIKSRVCSPSPSIGKVSLLRVLRRNLVITPLYGLFSFFGPYTLKNRKATVFRL